MREAQKIWFGLQKEMASLCECACVCGMCACMRAHNNINVEVVL